MSTVTVSIGRAGASSRVGPIPVLVMSTVQTESLDSATAAHGTVAAVHGDVAVIKVDPAATGRVLVAASPTDVTPALPDAIAIWPGGEDAVALKPGDRIHVVDG